MPKGKAAAPKETDAGDYQADSIQVLKGLEAVRRRPAMYIGSVSARGLHHLVYEVVDNSVDEALTRHGQRHHMAFERGETTKQLEVIGKAKGTGTTVWFQPDPTIFTETRFDYATLATRLRELAFLNKGLTITLKDERKGSLKEETFIYK